jgi:ligand-binding SRPBCC domain-containing protein
MTRIHLETRIAAPIDRLFELARSIDIHLGSMEHTGERAIAGVTSGTMNQGDTVTWEARHLGFTRRLTSHMAVVEPPHRFIDEQIAGPFAYFRHIHEFKACGDETLMTDELDYGVPYGWLGSCGDRLILKRHLRNLLLRHNAYLQRVAEAGFIPSP